MTRILSSMVLAAIALLAWPGPARAAESYDNCTGFIDSLPAVISSQGTWCLRKDLSTAMASGNAISINTNNVTLDCNDFKIGGLAAGPETKATGVGANNRFNTTVRNCRIRGFGRGIDLSGSKGGGHKVEGNTLEGSRGPGMIVRGAGSMVRGNRVIDSRGSTRIANILEIGIEVWGGVDVIDNLVRGVRPFPIQEGNGVVIPRHAGGIRANNNDGGNIIGNRVSGVVPVGSGTVGYGIFNYGSTVGLPSRVIVSGNILKGARSSAFTDVAIRCVGSGSPDAISVDNVLVGFDIAIEGCSSSLPGDNSVNSN